MAPIDFVFDATTVAPKQGGGAHPVGNKFPFKITDTSIDPTKDNSGGMFVVELTSDVGSIKHRYNLWNQSEAAKRIAWEQLSALCHATGVMKIDFKNDGKAFLGAGGMMDIGFQKGHEPSPEKPEGGYVELKKVYDRNGNEPGKTQQTQQQPQGQQQPNAAGASAAWAGNGNPNAGVQQGNGAYPAQQGFNPNPNTNSNPQQTSPQQNAGGWTQGAGGDKPPWG
jgi:hypothetical protein